MIGFSCYTEKPNFCVNNSSYKGSSNIKLCKNNSDFRRTKSSSEAFTCCIIIKNSGKNESVLEGLEKTCEGKLF